MAKSVKRFPTATIAVSAAIVAASLTAYLAFSLFILPQSYQSSLKLLRPKPEITDIKLSASKIALGEAVTISVTGTNRGDDADLLIVSIGFPNLTRTTTDGNNNDNNDNDNDNGRVSSAPVQVLRHNFLQTPVLVSAGETLGSEYVGLEKPVIARYASVEAFSRPWEGGRTYSIDLQVKPGAEGRFVVFVKSVALPHSWEGAHWPQNNNNNNDDDGGGDNNNNSIIKDPQNEFVQVYSITVTGNI